MQKTANVQNRQNIASIYGPGSETNSRFRPLDTRAHGIRPDCLTSIKDCVR